MALVTNALTAYTAIGIREDLTDVIYDISPMETPFMSNVARNRATNKIHEWQTDSLAAAAANTQLEGNTIAAGAITVTVRPKNHSQISYKAFAVTGTTEASDAAGRASETSYQVAKHGKELKRDMEKALTGATGSVLGSDTVARTLAGVEAWLSTNYQDNGIGTTPGFVTSSGLVTAPTDGTTRAISETLLKGSVQTAWSAGGDPNVIMCGPTTKQDISGFSGIGTLYQDITRGGTDTQGTIIGAADLYISDFGRHAVVPNRFSRDRTALVLDMSMWAVSFLRPIFQFDLAKTGDAEQKVVLTEFTLESRNEAASAKIADIT
jgi:hypothetical protein